MILQYYTQHYTQQQLTSSDLRSILVIDVCGRRILEKGRRQRRRAERVPNLHLLRHGAAGVDALSGSVPRTAEPFSCLVLIVFCLLYFVYCILFRRFSPVVHFLKKNPYLCQ